MRCLFIKLLILFSIQALAQSAQLPGEPQVGKRCPDFTLDKIDFYSKKKVTLDDFKGKWLILDFWSKDCSTCIASFPRISKEQEELSEKVQFIMVTLDDTKVDANNNLNQHRSIYKNYHRALSLTMPAAFAGTVDNKGNSTGLWKQFNIGKLPHVIIIDPNGIVRGITSNVSIDKLKQLLSGKETVFREASYAVEKDRVKLNPALPFEVNGNGAADSDFLFRSLLSQWKPGIPIAVNGEMIHHETEVRRYHNQGRFEALGIDLGHLYRIAYIGRNFIDGSLYGDFWPLPVLEISDTSLFKGDFGTGQNLYCYSMVVPPAKATEEFMLYVMQTDLQRYFAFDVRVEAREMPCWKLVITDRSKIKLRPAADSVIATSYIDRPWQGGDYKNVSFEDFFGGVKAFMGLSSETEPPIIDETGIDGRIDISVEWYKRDYNSVRKALLKNGLDLIESKKEMKVIVIRDPK